MYLYLIENGVFVFEYSGKSVFDPSPGKYDDIFAFYLLLDTEMWQVVQLHSKWSKKSVNALTHWGRVTHISVSKLTIIGSDNGLAPSRRQAIILTNAGILLIEP